MVTPRARTAGKVLAMADDGKKKILRENEKEAWLSEMEKEGANPSRIPWRWWRSAASPSLYLVAGALGYIVSDSLDPGRAERNAT